MASLNGTTGNKLEGSSYNINPTLDVFATEPTNISVERSEYVVIRPDRLDPYGSIELTLSGSTEHYTDLYNSFLQVEATVVQDDGSDITGNDDDAVVWMGDSMHTLFSELKMSIEGTTVEYANNYGLRSYFSQLLENSAERKKYQGKMEGWLYDDSTSKDAADHKTADKKKRRALIIGGKTIELTGKPHLALFQQKKLIIPGPTMQLEFERASGKLALFAANEAPAGGAKIRIDKFELHLCKVKVNPTIQNSQLSLALEDHNYIYPVDRKRIKLYGIRAGVAQIDITLEENKQKPKQIYLGLVNHNAMNGRFALNPYRMQHASVDSIVLRVGDCPIGRRFEPNYARGVFGREYHQFLHATGTLLEGDSLGITKEQYLDGTTLYGFDLTGDFLKEGFHSMKNVTTSVEICFSTNTADGLSLVAYFVKDGVLEMDSILQLTIGGDAVL